MAMPITIPRYTVDEIESWPDDGNRYELLDGVLQVSPQPAPPHQIVATRLMVALAGFVARWPRAHPPDGMIVISSGRLISGSASKKSGASIPLARSSSSRSGAA
jgi:hypothetical protein